MGEEVVMPAKVFDFIDVKVAVRDGRLKFYVEGEYIYCSDLPINGEKCIVGEVKKVEVVANDNM